MHRFWVLLLVVGCMGSGERRATIGQAKATTIGAGTCTEKVTRMERRFATSAGRALPLPTQEVRLPRSSSARAVGAEGVSVAVRTGSLELEWEGIPFEDASEAILEATTSRADGPPRPVYLWADRKLKARYLFDLMVRDIHVDYRLVVALRKDDRSQLEPVSETPDWAMQAWKSVRETRDKGERSQLVSSALTQAVGECAPLQKAFARVYGIGESAAFADIAKRSMAAIRECKCQGVSVDAFEAMMLASNGATDPPVGWLPLTPEAAAVASGDVGELAQELALKK